jgi:hypothetical protein
MKKRLLVGILASIGLVFGMGLQGCGPQGCVQGCDASSASVRVLSAVVAPSSGEGGFQLTVGYEWKYDGLGTIPHPDRIKCYYYLPKGDYAHIGDIDPAANPTGYVLDKAGWIKDESTLPFDVRPSYSSPQPGPYVAKCFVGEGKDTVNADFAVVAAAETTTTEAEATSTTALETTTTQAAATATTAAAASANWYIRVYNSDDHGAAYVNGTQVAAVDFDGDSGWVDVTSMFSSPTTSVRFTMANDLQGYAWGFAIKRNDTVVWEDVQGEVNVQGANNNDQSRQNATVYDRTFSVSQTGQVTPAP